MKICLAQQNYHIGNFEANTQKIADACRTAIAEGAEMIIFSELAICGYPPRDFLEFDEFLDKCYKCIESLLPLSEQIAIIVGAPAPNPRPEGKNLFNSAYFLFEGKIQHIVHKALLPNYDIFDEYRYFEPGFEFKCIGFKGRRLAVTICEDIWDIQDDPVYRFRPLDILVQEQPDFIINLSASPFSYLHAENRAFVIGQNVGRYQLPMIYCNTVGSQTEINFDGGSIVCNADGSVIAEFPHFEEHLGYVIWNGMSFDQAIPTSIGKSLPKVAPDSTLFNPERNIERIHKALTMGIRDYFQKMGFKKAVVASSGGIDSAVTLALAVEALGKENVHALLMPSQFSTAHSVTDAEQLSQNLDNRYDTVAIKDIFDKVSESLKPIFGDAPFDVTEENIQSRIRGLLVMALANKYNYILLNTSNKSELATGYGTLYGDMAGGISVLGDLYKTQVYALARYINRDKEVIPEHILIKAPSAELRPGQKDSDSLPDYNVLDQILYQYIERRQGLQDIIAMGFEPQLVERCLKMINRNEYKRNQFCPIIRVSSKAFGIGRRIPIVAKYEV